MPFFWFLLFTSTFSFGQFHRVNSDRPYPRFETALTDGILVLKNSNNKMAQETLNSLSKGCVQIGSFVELTQADYKQLLEDLPDIDLKISDYKNLASGNEFVLKKIQSHLDGYAWENRIYIASNLKPRKFASTIVHEVNHVLNRSDIGYYQNALSAVIEEYRAYYVEALFLNLDLSKNSEIIKIKKMGLDSVGPAAAHIKIQDLPVPPPGALFPTPENWVHTCQN